jgi:hypothetical protein
MLSSHRRLSFPCDLLPSGFPTKNLHVFLFLFYHPHDTQYSQMQFIIQVAHTTLPQQRTTLFSEIIVVYCQNHMKHINTSCGQNAKFLPSK